MHTKLWINIDFLEAVGKPMPNTTDELLDVLRAFRDDDPNGNGEKDEIPMIAAMRDGWGNSPEYFIMNAFTFYDATLLAPQTGYQALGLYREDDVIKTPWAEPGTFEGLKYMRNLFDEGLLYEGSFTAETNAMVNLVEGSDVPRIGAVAAGHGYIFSEVGGPRYAQFRGLMPLEGPDGRREIRKNIYDVNMDGGGGFYISATTPYAVELVKWADYLYDFEATANGYFGPEGTHWRRAEPGELGLDGLPAVYKVLIPWNETEPHNDHWIQQCISYRSSAFRAGEVYIPGDPDAPDAFEKRLYDTTADMEQFANTLSVMPPVKLTVDENNAISIPMTDLANLVKQYIPGFINGTYDLDSEYDSFLKALDDMGLQDVLVIYQKAYDAQWKGR
jgi:putative aldouronate transport system substrate-binding protein